MDIIDRCRRFHLRCTRQRCVCGQGGEDWGLCIGLLGPDADVWGSLNPSDLLWIVCREASPGSERHRLAVRILIAVWGAAVELGAPRPDEIEQLRLGRNASPPAGAYLVSLGTARDAAGLDEFDRSAQSALSIAVRAQRSAHHEADMAVLGQHRPGPDKEAAWAALHLREGERRQRVRSALTSAARDAAGPPPPWLSAPVEI